MKCLLCNAPIDTVKWIYSGEFIKLYYFVVKYVWCIMVILQYVQLSWLVWQSDMTNYHDNNSSFIPEITLYDKLTMT